MILLFTIITFLYLLLILWLAFGFDKVKNFKVENLKPETKFSIIIPFRNEAKNLPELLTSIGELNYNKTHYEFIFVDDESSDNSVEIITNTLEITQTNIKIIKNVRVSNSP